MPGSMPATSQLEWLSSTTAMIVLFWSRATRDLLRSLFDWGIAALHRLDAATKLPCLAARPIASIGPAPAKGSSGRCNRRRHERRSHLQVQVRKGQCLPGVAAYSLSLRGGTGRSYGACGEDVATSSLQSNRMECRDAPAERL